jgi:acyl carrier protein
MPSSDDSRPVASDEHAASVRQVVIDWLDDHYHFGEAAELVKDDDTSFLRSGILDSLGFVQLILHLEATYAIKIDRRELAPANFDSLGKIHRYVAGRVPPGGARP